MEPRSPNGLERRDAPEDEELLVSVSRIREIRDRDSRSTDDGGSSGRSDGNDNAIF